MNLAAELLVLFSSKYQYYNNILSYLYLYFSYIHSALPKLELLSDIWINVCVKIRTPPCTIAILALFQNGQHRYYSFEILIGVIGFCSNLHTLWILK